MGAHTRVRSRPRSPGAGSHAGGGRRAPEPERLSKAAMLN
jgi:hypothetical protein